MGRGQTSGPESQVGDSRSWLWGASLSVSRCQSVWLGVSFRRSPDSSSETASSARARPPAPAPRPLPAPAGPRSPDAGWVRGGMPLPSAQSDEQGGTAGRAGGGSAGEPRGAGALLRAGAAARPAPARLSAGSGFFRERLPWVTRLRGDTALPSPSGNLSIREIDNPQRRAAHPLGSPSSGASRPKVAPLAREGGDVGADPPPWTWPPAAGGGAEPAKSRFRGAAWGRLLSLSPSPRGPRPEPQLVPSCGDARRPLVAGAKLCGK